MTSESGQSRAVPSSGQEAARRAVLAGASAVLQLGGAVGLAIAVFKLVGVAPPPVSVPEGVGPAQLSRELSLLHQSVPATVWSATLNSLLLLALGATLGLGAGILLAALGAAMRHGAGAGILLATLILVVPTFLLAVLVQELQAAVAGQTGLLVAAGFGDFNLAQVAWAAVVLSLRPAARVFRAASEILDEEIGADYVRTALAFGHGFAETVWTGVLPVAGPRLVVAWLNSFRLMIGVLPLVEFFFGYPGLGRVLILSLGLTYTGGARQVLPDLALGLVISMTVVLVAVEAVSRAVQLRLDPRPVGPPS